MEPQLQQLPIAKVKPAKDNIRQDVGDVAELAASIATVGLLEPLVACQDNGHFTIVAGARRLAAAKLAGLKTVPTIVREFDEQTRIEAMLIENLQRTDLTPFEEAHAYRRLIDDVGLTQRDLATRIGRGQGHISKRLSLLQLPAAVHKRVDSGGITIGAALELAKLADKPAQLKEVLEELDSFHDPISEQDAADVVEQGLRDAKRDEAIAAERAKLEAAGVRVIEYSPGKRAKGTVEISKQGGDYWALKLDPKKHASEPCHAAALVTDWKGRVTVKYYCTDRKRHPGLKTQNEQSSVRASGNSAKRREHEKELGVARKARREFIATLLDRKTGKDDAVALIVDALIERAEAEARKIACEFLGLEPKKKQYGQDTEAPLRELAGKSTSAKVKVGLALAYATQENRLSHSWWSPWRQSKPYFEQLEARGYTTTPAEKRELAGKAPKGQ